MVLQFDETMDRASVEAGFSLMYTVPSPTPAAGVFSWSTDNKTMTFNPNVAMEYLRVYTITLLATATDTSSVPLEQTYTATFTTVRDVPDIK